MAEQYPFPIDVALPPGRFSEGAELTAYYVIAEAISNAVKHARARRITISGEAAGGWLSIAVSRRRAGRRLRRRRHRASAGSSTGSARSTARPAWTARPADGHPDLGADTVRIGIAEDSALFRDGLTMQLGRLGVQVVITAGTGDELLAQVTRHPIDAAIIDVKMPPNFTDDGLQTAEKLAASHPATGILMLSQYAELSYATRLFTTGTAHRGYLLKDRVANAEALRDALQRVCRGESVVDEQLIGAPAQPPAAPEQAGRPHPHRAGRPAAHGRGPLQRRHRGHHGHLQQGGRGPHDPDIRQAGDPRLTR